MDLGSILLILALLLLTGLYVTSPLYRHKIPGSKKATRVQGHEISALLAEHDQIINALRELDFDFSLRKLPEEDYPVQRDLLLNRGAEILRLLDEYQQRPPAVKREQVKDAVSASSPISAKAAITDLDDDIEAKLATRRRDRQEKAGGFCPQCGNPYKHSDRFCSKCGESLVS